LKKIKRIMAQLMDAICIRPNEGVRLEQVPRPENPAAGHLIIKMNSSAINPGDKAFITRPLPPGSVTSLYNVYGASGAGKVIAIGEGVPANYPGKNVSLYRSLYPSTSLVGAWSEYTQIPYLACAILPENANPINYSGTVLNMMTPYAFFKQVFTEGYKGIINTGGTSATGIAMVGLSLVYKFPLVSIVRNEEGKKRLEGLGAEHVVVEDEHLAGQLREIAGKLEATAVFDGVGGSILNKIIGSIPNGSTIYSYGYLGDNVPLTTSMMALASKSISIRPFANFRTATVQNRESLQNAMQEFADIIDMPHFKTPIGKTFKLSEINEALAFSDGKGGKAILTPGGV
jgi:NADPH:quinone reductase